MASAKEPDLPRGFLGPQSKFKTLKLGVLSHTNNTIQMTERDGNQLRVQISYTDPMKTTYSLIDANTKEERSECVFSETSTEEHIITYHITVPSTGFWKFQIFANLQSEESKSLPGVFNYLIHCVKADKTAHSYPKQYQDWKDGCQLIEPMILHPDVTGPTVRFRVVIPDAKKVAVIVDQVWNHLILSQGEWTGNIHIGNQYGANVKVTVSALNGSDGDPYSTLLEYDI